jgi:hypothetical protein
MSEDRGVRHDGCMCKLCSDIFCYVKYLTMKI